MFKDIKAAIFDLDGTLIDSMWIWEKIDTDYLTNKGYAKPENLKDEIGHLSFEQTAIYFKNKFNISDTVEDIMKEWHSMAVAHYTNDVKLKPGAKDFLMKLKSLNVKIGLATSNSQELLKAALEANGIYELFDTITTTDEVSRGKNFPDVYLLSAEKLGANPNECVVFEDILPAVQGAKAAGMKVVAVYDDSSKDDKEKVISLANNYIESYLDIVI
ncbi:HAD family hydrolase [Clostridium folliculivorans]|uniref:Haloacid dehalogenase n=1 Tax=Clostridium folliculivorans TaxID=2886038 RepID=A0A9W5Y599_9CLOT|nr:HAD family phosphatase [Clostridium folliculivorans]GKU26908.1 haloacid dehalogenase [Clostridium folliculivorans]GKU31559.1 haloacid dehalogenase [Clostridium folliculivorans]